MKTSSSAIKILTVSVFVTLIILFVCYRVGTFDNDSTNINYSEIKQGNFDANSLMGIDTPVVEIDSFYYQEIMSSSKSMAMPRPNSKIRQSTFGFDTLKVNKDNYGSVDSAEKKEQKKILIMSSSKSAVMFDHKLVQDTTKKKPRKKSNTMSSSKSGIIYESEPQTDTAKKPK